MLHVTFNTQHCIILKSYIGKYKWQKYERIYVRLGFHKIYSARCQNDILTEIENSSFSKLKSANQYQVISQLSRVKILLLLLGPRSQYQN